MFPSRPRAHSWQRRPNHEGFSDREATGRRSRAHSAVASSIRSQANSTTTRSPRAEQIGHVAHGHTEVFDVV